MKAKIQFLKDHWAILTGLATALGYLVIDIVNLLSNRDSITSRILTFLFDSPVTTIWGWIILPLVGFIIFFSLWLRLHLLMKNKKRLVQSNIYEDNENVSARVYLYAKGKEIVESVVVVCCKKCKTQLIRGYRGNELVFSCPQSGNRQCGSNYALNAYSHDQIKKEAAAIIKSDFVKKNKKYRMRQYYD